MKLKTLLCLAFMVLGIGFLYLGTHNKGIENFPFEDMIISLIGILFVIIGLIIKKSTLK